MDLGRCGNVELFGEFVCAVLTCALEGVDECVFGGVGVLSCSSGRSRMVRSALQRGCSVAG